MVKRTDYATRKEYKWAKKNEQRPITYAAFLLALPVYLVSQSIAAATIVAVAAVVILTIFQQSTSAQRWLAGLGDWKPGKQVTTASGMKGTVKAPVEGRPGFYVVELADGSTTTLRKVSREQLKQKVDTPQAGAWSPGTRVNDAKGRTGVVKNALADRPGYYLVEFEDGTTGTLRKVSAEQLKKEAERKRSPSTTVVSQDTASSPAQELERLTRLHRDGALTAEEFRIAKAKALG